MRMYGVAVCVSSVRKVFVTRCCKLEEVYCHLILFKVLIYLFVCIPSIQ
jgi:hypothetical protein